MPQTYNSAKKLIEVGLIKITYRGGFARGDMNTYELLPTVKWYHSINRGGDYTPKKLEARDSKSKRLCCW